ncbi:ATP-binding protein [Variovorax sp. YR216]|uniref:ATP-binding protein n=1 Tax=Variovorax sp. YR216 TaxID=1882828 RepID=UPI00210A2D7D|nr:ATP-binding protein [Variovorax sp. YR216]
MPSTLLGRLALLLFVAVLVSHVLALTLMFELRPEPPPGHRMHEPHPHGPQPFPGFFMDVGVRLGALMLAAWIGARWLSQPIKQLAAAAREIGLDIHRPPMVENGTVECRAATRVFNQMQAQIRRQLDERDRFVAAVSHDLRTPLTRLALRAEGLADTVQRQQFRQDIVEMNDMITATLDYLRGAAAPEPFAPLDVASLLNSLADDRQGCGQDVRLTADSARPIEAQTSSLRRCVDNLVENAVRYGGQARIRLSDHPDRLCIEVRDEGPGIPAVELERVLEPFYRLEGSRNRSHGGVGLGLSIAQDIARRHRGTLELRNGEQAGLVVTLTLPRLVATSAL